MPEDKDVPQEGGPAAEIEEIHVEGFLNPVKVAKLADGSTQYAFTRPDGTVEAAQLPAGEDDDAFDEAEEALFAAKADRQVAEDKWTLEANDLVVTHREKGDVLPHAQPVPETEPGVADALAHHFETADTVSMQAVTPDDTTPTEPITSFDQLRKHEHEPETEERAKEVAAQETDQGASDQAEPDRTPRWKKLLTLGRAGRPKRVHIEYGKIAAQKNPHGLGKQPRNRRYY